MSWQKKMFSDWIQNTKLLHILPQYCSSFATVKQNTPKTLLCCQLLALLQYWTVLKFHALFGIFPAGLITWEHISSINSATDSNKQPRTVPRGSVYADSMKGTRASVMFKAMVVPSVNVNLLSRKFPLRRRSSNENETWIWQQVDTHLYPPFCSPLIPLQSLVSIVSQRRPLPPPDSYSRGQKQSRTSRRPCCWRRLEAMCFWFTE